MADRKITYSLDFVADTKDVKTQLDQVGHSLHALASYKVGSNISDKMKEASNAALRMKEHLDHALDPKTGKLDLTRLAVSMKNSGDSAKSLEASFAKAGKTGQKAFLQVANSIANAQPSMIRTNKLMEGLWVSLKNTAKWQLSSTVLRGFTSALSSAVSFAKELNKSLNDIRIVSGDSADEMKRFAKEANNMAKAVGTSTTDITKGTLIYRQQGDDMELAAKKAEITAKAAAITTESSAEEMSEYLTGIWNSYKVGSEDLETFVDKLAYVGATTATSMEEIATSMTKVAATANTVGVEYEQLLGIIATVSSATRVSAEQVGTAYKTILARMGDLKLEGSVDEDGITTTLGDVSSTLKQAGVDILDAQGNLRDMGDVVEELGDKWNTFDKGQKTAIANVVAGKRQYTQLFALFENWDKYESSVEGAAKAQGELNKQHGVYLESWEASSERIKANLEDIIMDAYNDEGILSLMDGFASVLGLLDKIIEGAGGLGPILLMLGSIGTRVFSQQIGSGLANAWTNLLIFFGQGEKISNRMRTEWSNAADSMAKELSGGYKEAEIAQEKYLVSLLEFQNKFDASYRKMSDSSRQFMERQQSDAIEGFNVAQLDLMAGQKGIDEHAYANKTVMDPSTFSAKFSSSLMDEQKVAIDKLVNTYKQLGIETKNSQTSVKEMAMAMAQSDMTMEEMSTIIKIVGNDLNMQDDERENLINDIQRIRDGILGIRGVGERLDFLGESLPKYEDRIVTTTEKMSHLSSGIMGVASASMTLNSMWSTLASETADFGEKFSSVAMTVPTMIMSFNQLTNSLKAMGWAAKAVTTGTIIGVVLMLLPSVIKLANTLIVTAEEAREEASKAADKLAEINKEIEDGNKALEEKKEKLEEILKLEMTEGNRKQELQLRKEIELLEQKEKILQRTQKIQEKQVEKTAKAVIKKQENEIQADIHKNSSILIEKGYSAKAQGEAYTDLLDNWYGPEGKVSKMIELANKSDTETAEKIMEQVDMMNDYLEERELTYAATKELEEENDTNITRQEIEERKKIIKQQREATEALEEAAKAQEALANPIKNTIEELKGLDDAFDTVNKGIDEFKEEGKLSYDTIAELQEEFGEARKGMTEFYEGLANGTVTLEEYRIKMIEIIEQKLIDEITTGKLNGANKAMIESYLKSKGVINAAEAANRAYAMSLARNKISTEGWIKNLRSSFVPMEYYAELLGIDTAACYKLFLEEIRLNNLNLNFSQKLTALKNLGNAMLKDIAVGSALHGTLTSLSGIHFEALYTEKDGKLVRNKNNPNYQVNMDKLKEIAEDLGVTGSLGSWQTPDGDEYNNLYEATFQAALSKGVSSIDTSLFDLNFSGTPGDDDKEGDKKDPVEIDWVSALLGEAAKETSWRQKELEKYQEELDFLDEEKGQFEEILQKNNDILWVINQLKDIYDKRKNTQSSIFDQTMASYKSTYGFNFDKDTILSWFNADGEQSLAFSNLLLSYNYSPETQEALQAYWDDIKKIVDDVTKLNDELKELNSTELDTLGKIYDTKVKEITADIQKLEDANTALERSPFINYNALRKNNKAMQELYMSLYRLALEEDREAEAREHLAKWWELEADNIKTVNDEYDRYRETYDAIVSELDYRREKEIESLDYQIQRLQYRNTLTQSYNDTLNTLKATQHEIDKQLKSSLLSEKYLSEAEKEKIFNAKDYLVISKQIATIEEEIQNEYSKYQYQINKLEDDQIYKAELLTKEFEKQTAEKKQALEILKMEIDLTKKRQALTDALSEKNVRVYQGGRWTQVANYTAVQSAADALADTEYQIAEKKRQNAQELEIKENELRIAQLEEKKQLHEAEKKAIEEMTKVLDDAKKKWETGFNSAAVSAQDLSKAFYAAKEYLDSGDDSVFSYYNRKKFFSSSEGQELYTIYQQKVNYETSASDGSKATASAIASSIRNNSSSAEVKATANMSAAQMKQKYGFASGTNDTPSGIARINERGLELYATNSGQFIELSPHGKIFNNDQFDYLYSLSRGKTSMDAAKGAGGLSIGQMSLTLPNVTDTPSFVEGLKHLNEYIKNTMNF